MTTSMPVAHNQTLADITATLAGLSFELRRSWPRADDHLLLDLSPAGRAGASVAGQWFRDPERARSTANATPGATWSGQLVLHPRGGDRVLASLAELVQAPGTQLISHRPERRAVLRHRHQGAMTYTKVVAPKRHRGLERTARATESLDLRTPRVLTVDPGRGTVVTEALPGRPLHALLAGPAAEQACDATGTALAAMHRLPLPDGVPTHGLADEQAVTERWQRSAAAFGAAPSWSSNRNPAPEHGHAASTVALIHRDFHDQQVLVDDDGSVGILDFDLMAVGDPALDLANLLVHLDLRARQCVVTSSLALRAAVLRGYCPTERVADRLAGYEALAWRRLAAVYAFRPTATVT